MRAALVALSLYLTAGATLNVWALYVVVAGLAIADAFYKPALLSLIPSLVEQPALVHANSLVNSTNYGVLALGYGLGGLLMLRFGLATMVAIMEFLEHWPHGLWTAALMLVFTTEALNVSEAFWGYQNALYFGGNLAGAALAVVFAPRLARRPGWVIIVNAFLMALLTVSYALSPNIWVAMITVLLYGPPMTLRDVAQDSLLQSSVDGAVLGRVYATRQALAMFAFMSSGLLLATLADLLPVRMVYLFGAALYLGAACYALSQPSLRRAGLAGPQEVTVLALAAD
jgi:hypothetical protein